MQLETRSVFPAEIEYRQKGRKIEGRFPYGGATLEKRNIAVVASRGRVRKETFGPRAFSFAVEDETREINLLSGHSFSNPLASKLRKSLVLRDTDEALEFVATLPPENEQPTFMRDAVLSLAAGLLLGISPGFQVPPASAVPNAETVVPEPGNPSVGIRIIRQAVLVELSLVARPAYPETELDMRGAFGVDDGETEAAIERALRWL